MAEPPPVEPPPIPEPPIPEPPTPIPEPPTPEPPTPEPPTPIPEPPTPEPPTPPELPSPLPPLPPEPEPVPPVLPVPPVIPAPLPVPPVIPAPLPLPIPPEPEPVPPIIPIPPEPEPVPPVIPIPPIPAPRPPLPAPLPPPIPPIPAPVPRPPIPDTPSPVPRPPIPDTPVPRPPIPDTPAPVPRPPIPDTPAPVPRPPIPDTPAPPPIPDPPAPPPPITDPPTPDPPTPDPPAPDPSAPRPPPGPPILTPTPPLSPPLPPVSSGSTPSSPSLTPPTSFNPPPNKPPSNATPIAVGCAVGSVALLLALALFWFLCVRRKKRDPQEVERGETGYGPSAPSGTNNHRPSGEQFPTPTFSTSISGGNSSGYPPSSSTGTGGWGPHSSGTESSLAQGWVSGRGTTAFTYDELRIATNAFSSVNLLGQGGFGYVHKGLLQNGKLVAVKSLKADSGQGEREFQAEVETISRVHHKHLVTLVGYCITDSQKLLVYEFVQNKTMEFHLHGKQQPVMDWSTRLKIAVGAAKGLAYLHEDCHPKIIHRDIKAANILLDDTFEAQVADFGLAKFSSDANTHISTRVMGTFGYLAPEYAASGQLSEKSDVFSFGVLLLEFVTGRRPVDFTKPDQMEDSLVDWATPLFPRALQDGDFDILVDPRLGKDYIPGEMGAMITCAAACVRHAAKRRPKMSQVVRALEGNLALSDLSDGVKPGFSSSYSTKDVDSSAKTKDT